MRVYLGGMPRLLHDIVENVVRSQADMEIVCRCDEGIAAAFERAAVDVAVLRDAGSDPVPHERLVIVTYSERDGGAFGFRPLSVAGLSTQALVEALRETQPASKGHE